MSRYAQLLHQWSARWPLKHQLLAMAWTLTAGGWLVFACLSWSHMKDNVDRSTQQWVSVLAQDRLGPLQEALRTHVSDLKHPQVAQALNALSQLPDMISADWLDTQAPASHRQAASESSHPITMDWPMVLPNGQTQTLRLVYNAERSWNQAQMHWQAQLLELAVWLMWVNLLAWVFIRRITGSLTQIVQLAYTLEQPHAPFIKVAWASKEATQLGLALNRASHQWTQQLESMSRQLKREHAVVDTAVDAVIGVNVNGNIVTINRACERLFGRSPKELIGTPLYTLMPEATAAHLSQMMANGIWMESTRTRQSTAEMHGVRVGGTQFPAELLVGEIPDDPTVRYTCIVRDTTELKQAEDFLALYARALDCSIHGVMLTNARMNPPRLVYINPSFSRITGFEPQHVMGRDIGFLNGELTEAPALEELHRCIAQGQDLTVTLRQYRRDGQMFYNQMSVSPIRDAQGNITHTIHMIEDVTDLTESRARLVEHSARLDATFELSPDGFVIFDAQGRWQGCNSAFQTLLGGVASSITDLDSLDEQCAALCQDPSLYPRINCPDNTPCSQTLHLLRPTPRVLERTIRRNLKGSGETIVYLRDITHQSEVDQMKTEFLTTAAHELRTPLASILGYSELMLHRRYSEDRQKDMLQTIHRQANLLTSIINELLDLSRIEARQGKDFNIEPMPLPQLISEAVANMQGQDSQRDFQLGVVPDIQVMADHGKVLQALTNLLDNAMKYSTPGTPIEVWVETDAHSDDPPRVAIAVRDHGIGMTPEQLSRAFERFYRADASGHRPGTGLGLNLVREIAHVHGGDATLESTVGQGSTARFVLRQAMVTAK